MIQPIEAIPVQEEEPIVIHIDPVEAEPEENAEEYNNLQIVNMSLCFLTTIWLPLIISNFLIGTLKNECNTKPRIGSLTIRDYLVFTSIYKIVSIIVLFYMYNVHGVKKITDFQKSIDGKIFTNIVILFGLIWYLLALIIFSTMSKDECMPYTYPYFEFFVVFMSIMVAFRLLTRVCGELL